MVMMSRAELYTQLATHESAVIQLLDRRPIPHDSVLRHITQLEDIVCEKIDPVWQFDLSNEWRIKIVHLRDLYQAALAANSTNKSWSPVVDSEDSNSSFNLSVDSDAGGGGGNLSDNGGGTSSKLTSLYEIAFADHDTKAKRKLASALAKSFQQLPPIDTSNAETTTHSFKQLLALVGKSIRLLQPHRDDIILQHTVLDFALRKLPPNHAASFQLTAPPADCWRALVNLLRKQIIKADYELYRLNGGKRIHRLRKKYGMHVWPVVFCNFCMKEGHMSDQCAKHRAQSLCFRCLVIGHRNTDCPNEELIV